MREGPDHYTRLKPEPIDVINAWGLSWNLSNAIKYIARCDAKGGDEDIDKAIDYLRKEKVRRSPPRVVRGPTRVDATEVVKMLRSGWNLDLTMRNVACEAIEAWLGILERAEPEPPKDRS